MFKEDTMPSRSNPCSTAWILSLIATLAMAAALWLSAQSPLPVSDLAGNSGAFVNVEARKIIFYLLVALVATACLFIVFIGDKYTFYLKNINISPKLVKIILILFIAANFSYLLFEIKRHSMVTLYFADIYGMIILPSRDTVILTTAIGAIIMAVTLWFSSAPSSPWLWALPIVYAAAVMLPGLFTELSLVGLPIEHYSGVEWHFDATFSASQYLELGLAPAHLSYGILRNILIALLGQILELSSWEHDLRLVQVFNLVSAGLVIACCMAWRWWAPIQGLVLTLASVPLVQTWHWNLFFPNQAGWRSIGFLVVILALCLARKRPPRKSAAVLGLVSALCLLWNPETGVPCSIACLVFLGAKADRLSAKNLASLGWRFLAGGLAGFAIVMLLYWVATGSFGLVQILAQN